jgi:hypothetical protein
MNKLHRWDVHTQFRQQLLGGLQAREAQRGGEDQVGASHGRCVRCRRRGLELEREEEGGTREQRMSSTHYARRHGRRLQRKQH